MASPTLPILTGAVGAGIAGYYYAVTLEHALESRRDQTWWSVKYALVLVGGFALGRWTGVMVNALSIGTLTETLATYPLVAFALFVTKPLVAYHIYDNYIRKDGDR